MQIFKKIALSCCLLMMFVLAGCGANNEATLVGKWKVRTANNPNNNAMMAKMMESVTIDFKEDKTYVLNMGLPMEGTWAVDDAGKVTMKTTKFMGQDLSKLPTNSANSPVCQLNTSDKTLSFQMPNPANPTLAAQNALVFEKA